MKINLLYGDTNNPLVEALPENEKDLIQDLELHLLFRSMGGEDKYILDRVKKVFLSGVKDTHVVKYRQEIIKDCIRNRDIVRKMYDLTILAIEYKKKNYFGIFSRFPSSILQGSRETLLSLINLLRNLRVMAEDNALNFESAGFKNLFLTFRQELGEEYLEKIEGILRDLRFKSGVLLKASLGEGNKGINYILLKPKFIKGLFKQLFAKRGPVYSFRLAPRDDNGARMLGEIRDQGLNLAANSLARSADHILSFLSLLRSELAFYIGCISLYELITANGKDVCFPEPLPAREHTHIFQGLYDLALFLASDNKAIVGNDLHGKDRELFFITGTNQGGKSTFLRSLGIAQLMMQSGMYVPAEFFKANLCDGLFTHYSRKEDDTMESGKFDEELSRMSSMIDLVKRDSLILFNESFSSTNEREGAEIAGQIISAFMQKGIKIFYVTHIYELAKNFFNQKRPHIMFLRAERKEDGTRTFKIQEGEPLKTSYGIDLFTKIFNDFGNTGKECQYTADLESLSEDKKNDKTMQSEYRDEVASRK